MGGLTQSDFTFRWVRDGDDARRLAGLFAANVTPEYVSHGELQGPRALAPGQWVADIDAVLEREIVARIANPLDAPADEATLLAAGLSVGGRDAGVFLVTLSRAAPVPFGILEDMVVDAGLRGLGLGAAFLAWITAECRARGIRRLFLESGHDNHRAHEFFAREGFSPVSVVMMKDIG